MCSDEVDWWNGGCVVTKVDWSDDSVVQCDGGRVVTKMTKVELCDGRRVVTKIEKSDDELLVTKMEQCGDGCVMKKTEQCDDGRVQ